MSRSLLVEQNYKNGPFKVVHCECDGCMANGRKWLVQRDGDSYPEIAEYKHRSSAVRMKNKLDLAYAEYIMVQP